MIHAPFDPDQNWRTRQDSEAAERAIQADRMQRNAYLVTIWTEAFGIVALVAALAWGLSEVYRAGLLSWLNF